MGCSLEEEVIMLNSERVLNIRSIELTHYVLQAPPRNVWPSPPCRQSEALSGIISQDGRKQVGPKIELDMLGGSRLPWYKTIPKGCAPSYHCCAHTSTKYKHQIQIYMQDWVAWIQKHPKGLRTITVLTNRNSTFIQAPSTSHSSSTEIAEIWLALWRPPSP